MPTPPPVPEGPQEPIIQVQFDPRSVKAHQYPPSELEKSVDAAAKAAMERDSSPYMAARCEMARALASNVTKGNIKMRAVANEVQVLQLIMTEMQGEVAAAPDEATEGPLLSLVERLGSKPAAGVSARTVAG